MDQSLIIDRDLIRRYDKSGPRYTSYPTAVQFHGRFGAENYRYWAQWSNERSRESTHESTRPRPLSLYFHIPFCDTVCFYCACNKIVTKNRSRAHPYLERLHKEIVLHGALFDRDRPVDQLHWGGGTPTFISHADMQRLMRVTREHFTLRDDDSGEYSIEVDPREVSDGTIALLRTLGFNRISLGVQDFDAGVQRAVNRIQSEDQTRVVLQQAREQGFGSISIDLIYGLPLQSVASFARTLDKIIDANPDRLSIFNYAHLPELFKSQRRINAGDLPSAAEKLEILSYTIERLTGAGYVYIGMDHFAKPDDELAVAQRKGGLYRNFQGYSTHADCDLIGFGVTSISKVGNSYGQNEKNMDDYYRSIDEDRLPICRGIELEHDDLLRRQVITQLICHFELDIGVIEQEYDVNFQKYFGLEIPELLQMEADGLIEVTDQRIRVLPVGRLLIRNICMVFDRYLRTADGQRFSKVI